MCLSDRSVREKKTYNSEPLHTNVDYLPLITSQVGFPLIFPECDKTESIEKQNWNSKDLICQKSRFKN